MQNAKWAVNVRVGEPGLGTGRHKVSHTPPPKGSNAVRRTQKYRQF